MNPGPSTARRAVSGSPAFSMSAQSQFAGFRACRLERQRASETQCRRGNVVCVRRFPRRFRWPRASARAFCRLKFSRFQAVSSTRIACILLTLPFSHRSCGCLATHARARACGASRLEELERGTPNAWPSPATPSRPRTESKAILTTLRLCLGVRRIRGQCVPGDRNSGDRVARWAGWETTTCLTTRDMSVQVVRSGPTAGLPATLASGRSTGSIRHAENKTDETATVVFDPAGTQEKPKNVWIWRSMRGPALTSPPAHQRHLSRERRRRNNRAKRTMFYKAMRSIAHHFDKSATDRRLDAQASSIHRSAGKAFVLYDAPRRRFTSSSSRRRHYLRRGVGEKGGQTSTLRSLGR